MTREKPPLMSLVVLVLAGCTPTFALAKEVKLADVINIPDQIKLSALLGTPVVLADEPRTAFVKVGLEGLEPADKASRPPMNIAIVLDRSGSMAGEKLAEAKAAAIMAISRLSANDIVSVITYDDTVDVIFPAQPLKNKESLTSAINLIRDGGSTALFAGVSRGAAEIRKYLARNRVNRVILLSDGMANVGPSSPGELAALGQSLGREGVCVTTIGLGLGYNEDLMAQLALASDGNHAFAATASDLTRIFNLELGDAMAVAAQDVDVRVSFLNGVKPIRALGREGVIDHNTFTTKLNQVLAGSEKMILLEVELPPAPANEKRKIADITVSYADMRTQKSSRVDSNIAVETTTSRELVEKRTNQEVMIAAVELLANEQNVVALTLRDQGKTDEAKQLLQKNADYLGKEGKKYKSKRLQELEEQNRSNAANMDEAQWNKTRKQMRESQMDVQTQRSY